LPSGYLKQEKKGQKFPRLITQKEENTVQVAEKRAVLTAARKKQKDESQSPNPKFQFDWVIFFSDQSTAWIIAIVLQPGNSGDRGAYHRNKNLPDTIVMA
jgi:hypothetical protein